MSAPALTLRNIKKRFGKIDTIHGIDLDIAVGEFVVFVGPSGCGKSTLLRMIAGLEEVTEGVITINGIDVTHASPSARKVAMVFQSYALYPHMTVMENLTFGMRMRGVAKDVIAAKVKMAVDMLRLQPYLDRKPGALSGGQCQRVAIGRALVQEPDVFLFDEPLSNLDAELRLKTRIEIAALHKRLGKTMIYVTHDQVEAMTLADKIVVLRDGVIEQVGKPLDLYAKPANEFVAGFIGSPAMNFFPVEIAPNQITLIDSTTLPTQHAVMAQPGKLGVRPEHIRLNSDGKLAGTVKAIEALGATTFVYVDAFPPTEQTICIETRETHNLVIGQAVRFDVDAGQQHLFAENGRAIA